MKIKVCGMRDAENIKTLQELPIDYMGLIFWPRSPRCVNKNTPRCKDGEHTERVGVFVDQKAQDIITATANYDLDVIQLHGSESPVFCKNLRASIAPDIKPTIRIMKAISVSSEDDINKWKDYADCVDLLLFDTKCPMVGGSGKKFDWSVLENYDGPLPFLLSGGIDPDDAERVLEFKHPMLMGIDLNSRFETEAGVKDVEKLQTFISRLKQSQY